MVPQYPLMGSRNSRELRTLCLIIDRLCAAQVDVACDVAAQRIKAIEQSINDRGWDRAQHAELLPTEGAALLDKDEQWMLNKETELEARLRQRPAWRPHRERSQGQEQQQKGKGGKGWKKGAGKPKGQGPAQAAAPTA